jgi:hypothetical protein
MTTLREAALAALALVNDTLLERTVDTKRLSAVGRDLEDVLDAEHAQPVAEFHAHPADWQYNITLLPGVPMLLDGTKLYLAPQPPGDVPPMTDEDFVKIAFPYLDGALMEEIEMDGYALLEILRAVEAEVRRRCGVVE